MATDSPAHAQNQKSDIGWSEEVWERIHEEVHHELHRSRVVAKILPTVHVHTKTLSVPADVVAVPSDPTTFVPGAMTIDEGLTLRVNEQWTEFAMTPAQVEHEGADEAAHGKAEHPEPSQHPHPGHDHKHHEPHHISTGITLATRAANLLAQAEDALILQGADALLSPMFDPGSVTPLASSSGSINGVNYRGIPSDIGLLNTHLGDPTNLATTAIPVPWYQGQTVPAGTPSPSSKMYPQAQTLPKSVATVLQPVVVPPLTASSFPFAYQGNTVGAIAQAVSNLQAAGQN